MTRAHGHGHAQGVVSHVTRLVAMLGLAFTGLGGCGEDKAEPCEALLPDDAGAGFRANLCVRTEVDGATQCDGAVALHGRPDDGCPDCTFAFDVESEIVRDDGVDCPWWPELTWVAGAEPLLLAYAPTHFETGYDFSVEYAGALLQGRNDDERGVRWHMLGARDDGFERDGDTFTWTVEYASSYFEYVQPAFREYCEPRVDGSAEAPSTSGSPAVGELPYPPWYTDAWTMQPDEGTTVTVSVDNVTVATADCWSMNVNAEDGCTLANGWRDVDCAVPAPRSAGTCPALTFVADGGPYTVWVDNGACNRAELVEYELRADGDGLDLALTQTVNDIEEEYGLETPYTRSVVMKGRTHGR